MFGIPSKIDLDDEKYALEARKSTITAHLQACVKMLLDREEEKCKDESWNTRRRRRLKMLGFARRR